MSTPSSSTDVPEGIVVAVRPGVATVRVDERLACPRCAAGRGCGAGIFSRGGFRLVEVHPPPGLSLRVGQPVGLSLEPRRLLHAAWMVYGVPLFALFAAALAADYLVPGETSDPAAVVIAVAGLLCGGWWSRRQLGRVACAGRFVPSVALAGRRASRADDA
jgi:sigma-E factor negative regulatory protein RseC